MVAVTVAMSPGSTVTVIGWNPDIPDAAVRVSDGFIIGIDVLVTVVAVTDHFGPVITGFRLRRRKSKQRNRCRDNSEDRFHNRRESMLRVDLLEKVRGFA